MSDLRPLTGGSWNGAGLNDRAPEFLRRGKAKAVSVRDARGYATDISPHNPDGSVRWSPFAQDNTMRLDLHARRKASNGTYITVTTPNEGLYGLGAFKEGDGPSIDPKITNDRFMIEQSNSPYDTDLVEEIEPFSVTPVDTADPVYQRLRNNLPLYDENGNSLVEDPGFMNAGFGRLTNGRNPGRQFFFLRERFWNGLPIWSVTGVSLARLDDLGGSKMDKKDSEGSKLTFLPVEDGLFMAMQDGEYQPVLVYTWWGGKGWTALGGVPELSATAPTATPTGTGGVTLSFPEPHGPGDPWSYDEAPAGVQSSSDNGVTWGSLIEPTNVSVSSGVVTLTLTGIATGSKKFRVNVKGTNGAVATTPNSAAITVT